MSQDNLKYLAVRFPSEIQERVAAGQPHSHWGLPMDEKVHHTYNAEKHFPAYFAADQLYDLTQDPDEQRNLAADPAYSERLRGFQAQLAQISRRLPHRFGEFTP